MISELHRNRGALSRLCQICIGLALLMPLRLTARPTYRASEFGAKADGRSLDTAPLQRALDAAASAGGGDVVLGPGVYLTGSLFVKSHTHLFVSAGATILGTTERSAYPLIHTRAAGIEMQWPAALINVREQVDVSIEGAGTIDGNGKPWWDLFWSRVPAYEARHLRWAVDYDVHRPELIQVYKSDDVRIGRGLLLKRSAFWTVHICYSSNIVVDGLTIRDNDATQGRGPSTDGVDVDSSKHVRVQNVDIANNDDGICLKAGMNADGLRVNRSQRMWPSAIALFGREYRVSRSVATRRAVLKISEFPESPFLAECATGCISNRHIRVEVGRKAWKSARSPCAESRSESWSTSTTFRHLARRKSRKE